MVIVEERGLGGVEGGSEMLTHGMLTFHFLWKAGGMEERLAEWERVLVRAELGWDVEE